MSAVRLGSVEERLVAGARGGGGGMRPAFRVATLDASSSSGALRFDGRLAMGDFKVAGDSGDADVLMPSDWGDSLGSFDDMRSGE